jgi:two-component system sensor kinase FixL
MENNPNPERALHRRFLAAFAVIALVIMLNQLLVQPPIFGLMTDAPVINTAGRQRMLSQRLAKAALALERAADPPARRSARDELAGVLRDWTAAHRRLRDGEIAGPNSRAVAREFDAIEPDFSRMAAGAGRILKSDDTSREALADVLAVEPDYLRRMEAIVSLYEHEARARADRLLLTGWGFAALAIVALGAVGQFILEPATRLIARQFAELTAARDALERRVAERTGELGQATRDLARAALQRAQAEERHRRLLEQFGHVARTTTIGEMASGLAHELSQPLGAVANYAEGCLVALDAPEPDLAQVRAALERLLATTHRASEIVKRIRRFVTRHAPTVEPFDPNRLADEVAGFFGDEARRRGVTLRLDLAPQLPLLWGDPVQIQQVLVNLVRNAFEALAAARPELADPTIVIATRPADECGAEFAVTDNGEGIPAERLGRVFDPYFSTRDEGMGMGLAISRTLVEAHQGRFSVESTPGVRTTFRFTLPGRADDDGPATEADPGAEPDADPADGLHRGR